MYTPIAAHSTRYASMSDESNDHYKKKPCSYLPSTDNPAALQGSKSIFPGHRKTSLSRTAVTFQKLHDEHLTNVSVLIEENWFDMKDICKLLYTQDVQYGMRSWKSLGTSTSYILSLAKSQIEF